MWRELYGIARKKEAPQKKYKCKQHIPLEIKVNFHQKSLRLNRWGQVQVYRNLQVSVRDLKNLQTFAYEYYMYTGFDDPASRFIPSRDFITDFSSPLSYKLAAECLEACNRYHDQCPKFQPTPLPTRVIDCIDPWDPKLLISSGILGNYAALSYVWGEGQPDKTTTKNIDEYTSSGINPFLIPKTIQDAILATHKLGLRYLWVDSLCILQDCEKDKSHEIAQMRKIFQNAYVTLVAANAKKASEGFLHHRERPHGEFRLPFLCPDGVGIGSMLVSLTNTADFMAAEPEPVTQRAWCLEERVLSMRGFEYASNTIRFYCQTYTINVGGSPPLWIDGKESRRLPSLLLEQRKESTPLSVKEFSEVKQRWVAILEDYTSRTVTKPRDKLLALGGVAEQFHTVLGGKYLAGLWERDLHRCLLWRRAGQEPEWLPENGIERMAHHERPEVYRAPSWSWAAVDGAVRRISFSKVGIANPETAIISECEVLSCEISLLDENLPFGLGKGGTLKLRGPLTSMKWNPGASGKSKCGLIFEGHALPEDGLVFKAFPDSKEETSQDGWVEAWAMPIIWKEDYRAVGLILASVPTSSVLDGVLDDGVSTYRRIGAFETYHTHIDVGENIERLVSAPSREVNIV